MGGSEAVSSSVPEAGATSSVSAEQAAAAQEQRGRVTLTVGPEGGPPPFWAQRTGNGAKKDYS